MNKKKLSKEPKLVEVKDAKKIVFVGDTHGDLETSQKVVKNYLPARNASYSEAGGKPENIIVFLGDYVDRGPFSKENLDFLLGIKTENPNQVYLLQGNHEGPHIMGFSPADFWEGLDEDDYKKYTAIVENFPLALVAGDIIALHGVLPDVENLEKINKIELGSEQWLQITWGDFIDKPGQSLGMNPLTGRPEFGKDWFFKLMARFNKKVLIRSHQPDTPRFMFAHRCLTVFTSSAYTRERTIAIADLSKEIKTAKHLEIIKI